MNKVAEYFCGIDVGSTTSKIVVLDSKKKLVFSSYRRHFASIRNVLSEELAKVKNTLGDVHLKISITGSAGLGLAETLDLPFVQETIAISSYISNVHPEMKSLVDIGGEDSKLIFFKQSGVPDIRMNGNCAGGTGAFIDQMAQLLNIDLSELDDYASRASKTYPIASRCGVFAKTDIQNLLGKKIPKEDIVLSIFHAVAIQTVNTLFRGEDIKPKVMLCGGPFTFFKKLQDTFCRVTGLNSEDVEILEDSLLLTAMGTALFKHQHEKNVRVSDFIEVTSHVSNVGTRARLLNNLFKDEAEYATWNKSSYNKTVKTIDLADVDTQNTYLGVDAGSTTTKIVLVNEDGNIAYKYYSKNEGDILKTVKQGLQQLFEQAKANQIQLKLSNCYVTGYGEDLLKAALGLENGIVETLAHAKAAQAFDSQVSFILDIGGQDMKAIFLKNGNIQDIQINESCSSGCGSFIETFAGTLGYNASDFAQKACESTNPYDLGSRCTVFMNSKVKQCLRESVNIEDISAGLAYSVVKNCFQKVLKVNDFDVLGDKIVVQGGTFRNDAVYRAMQRYVGKEIIRPDICELMGAYGCALFAKENYMQTREQPLDALRISEGMDVKDVDNFTCKGCSNNCNISKYKFKNQKTFYTGNRCERFSSTSPKEFDVENFYEYKYQEIFSLPEKVAVNNPRGTIGIPRILNFYENFPYWKHLFTALGFEIVLSESSTNKLAEDGYNSIMSDNICFPAKLVHGHIEDLIRKKPARIFFPMVRFESREYTDAVNSYNCPVVTGYADVVKSAIDPESKDVQFDSPLITFTSKDLLRKSTFLYVKQLGVDEKEFNQAFEHAYATYVAFKTEVNSKAMELFESSKSKSKPIIVLAGRPYHLDPLIHHGIPQMIAELGAIVLTEDVLPIANEEKVGENYVLSQWQYSNRLYRLAQWVGEQENTYLVQLNSFGCGPDTIVMDEVKEIIESKGKLYTLLRIDEISNVGSAKLRIRSLIEAGMQKNTSAKKFQRKTTPAFEKSDRQKTVLAPYFSPYYSLFINSLFAPLGYNFVTLPEPNRESVETGLKYVNNDVCYPAVILIGDIIKALQTGAYDLNNTVAAITETGGQCRASNYVPLLKKALLKAGFDTIPVVSVSASSNTLNFQPGFKKKLHKMIPLALSSLLYIDALLKMYHSTKVRESNRGEAKQMLEKYFKLGMENMGSYKIRKSKELLKKAVLDFNSIPIEEGRSVERVGLVGEIYMKYNPFGNFQIEKQLEENNFEIVLPPLLTFFLESLVDDPYNHRNNIEKSSFLSLKIGGIARAVIDKRIDSVNEILKDFRFEVLPLPKINDLAEQAENLVDLINQFGEGWLLPGEMVMMAQEGIKNILCVQPFGCIANHVIAKGVARKYSQLFPDANLLLLDMDADSSLVNLQNRLELFVYQVKEKKIVE